MILNSFNNSNLKQYFEQNGFEVIDLRHKGGCLWVIGDPSSMKPYLDFAKEKYNAEGRFAEGKATRYRTGWFTKNPN